MSIMIGNTVFMSAKGLPFVKVQEISVELNYKRSSGWNEVRKNIRGGGNATDGIANGTNDLSATMHRDAITQDIANSLIDDISQAREIAPYAMTQAAVDALIAVGVPASKAFTGSHRHPLHKSLENYILYRVIPGLLTERTAVMWMKQIKFDRLRARTKLAYKLVNPKITPRDYSRYFKTEQKLGGFKSVFLHDAMHYLSPEDVMKFFRKNNDVVELVATVVYPTEVLKREPSFFPLVYDLVYGEKSFTYTMEGDPTDAYIQPYNDWVITTSGLKDKNLEVTIERVEGFFGHHVLVFRRGLMSSPDHFMAPTPDCLLLPNSGLVDKTERQRLVPRTIYEKAVHHARNLKSLRPQDAIAKVRSYQHDAAFGWVDPSAWEYLTTFVISAADLQGNDLNLSDDLNTSVWWMNIKRKWANRGKLPVVLTGLLGGVIGATPLTVVGVLKLLSAAAVGGIAGGYGFCLLVGLWFVLPPWLSPTEKEVKRLGMIYPSKFFRKIQLKKLKVKNSGGKFWNMGVEVPGEDDEFPEYKPLVAPEAKPDTIISNGTTIDDVGPSVSEVGVTRRLNKTKANYVDKGVNTSFVSSLEDFEDELPVDEDVEIKPTDDDVRSRVETLFEMSVGARALVNLPKVVLEVPSDDSQSRHEAVVDEGKLHVEQSGRLDEQPDVPTVNKLTRSKRKRMHEQRKKQEKLRKRLEDEAQNDITVDKETVVLPSEGEPGKQKLHEMFDLESNQVYCVYDGPKESLILFDGNFEEIPLCLIAALEVATGMSRKMLIKPLKRLSRKSIVNEYSLKDGLTDWHASAIAYGLGLHIIMIHDWGKLDLGVKEGLEVTIYHSMSTGVGHFSAVKPRFVKELSNECPEPGGFYGASSATNLFSDALKNWRGAEGDAVPFLGFRNYVLETSRAKPLARDMVNGRSGVVFGPNERVTMGPDTMVRWKSLVDGQENKKIIHRRRVHVAAIYGYPGCGKSWPVAQVLNKMIGKLDFRVAVPTVRLREEWQNMLRLPDKERWRINTYESAMRKNTEILVVDEISMMPAGYIDFLLAISPKLRCVLILGDVTQTDRFEVHPDATCSRLLPEALYWRKFSPFYLGYTRRLSKENAKLFTVKTYSKVDGFVAHRMTRGPEPIITALTGDAKALAELGTGATTFPSSQGSTFDHPVQILLDRAALERCSLGAVHTAVTRSRIGVILVGPLSGLRMKAAMANPFWNALITGQAVDWKLVFSAKLSDFKILDGPYCPDLLRGGANEELVEHNFPLGFLPPSRRVGHTMIREELPLVPGLVDYELREELPRVTWGQMDADQLFQQIYKLKPVDTDDRLKRYGGELALQFKDGKPEGKNVNGDYPEQIAARHMTKDVTLLPLSIPKRLRFAGPAMNKKELLSKFFVGQELFQSYCRLMKLNPLRQIPFDEQLYHACIEKNEWHSLTNKTQKSILANEHKSDPDWVWTFIRIFMKQQRKINVNTINGPWKAGQTISNMNDQWLLFLGPTIRYLTCLEKGYCPKKIYLHGGRSNIDLDNFCRENLRPGRKYANDYTSFDQSQTGEVLASELLYMWHASIPQFIIDLYETNKTQMRCFLGNLRTMRFSGEPATYAFNCRCNLAVMNLQFNLDNNSLPVFVSGDDGGLGGVLPERKSWQQFSKSLTLVAKPEISNRLVFVGYICTEFGAVRDPVPMLARFFVASDAGRLHLIVQSYATELSTGYLMAENIFAVLNDFELDCFFCLVRAFHLKHASSKLKFRKDALLGFVNLAERALGKLQSGGKLGAELKRDLVAFYWRLEEKERDAVYLQTQNLVKANLLQFGRRA